MQTSRAFAHFLLCLGKESTFRNRVQEYNPEREVLPTSCIGCVSVGAANGGQERQGRKTKSLAAVLKTQQPSAIVNRAKLRQVAKSVFSVSQA